MDIWDQGAIDVGLGGLGGQYAPAAAIVRTDWAIGNSGEKLSLD